MIKSSLIQKCVDNFIYSVGNLENYSELFVTSDSRSTKGKNTFLALYGEKFDGHKFIENLLDSEISLFIYEDKEGRKELAQSWLEKSPSKVFVAVKDIYSFILELGKQQALFFKDNGGKIISLTGSNGKTTNKEMLAFLLGESLGEDKVHFTKGNLNNHIGVPLTLFDIEPSHEVAIVEMGTNHPGEIKVLCDCALPDYGMITNIGHAHTEYLGGLEGVFKEKSALFERIKESKSEDKVFIANGFDPFLKDLKGPSWVRVVDEACVKIENEKFTITIDGSDYMISNDHLMGEHQLINMAMGLTLAFSVYPNELNKLVDAANSFKMKGMNRGEVRQWDNSTIYLDAYNANPSSMKASLNSFSQFLCKNDAGVENATVVLGDMNEIGENGPVLHQEIGELVTKVGYGQVLAVGRFAEYYKKGCPDAKTFASAAELKSQLGESLKFSEFVFIKGSRSLQLESILDITK